MGLIMDDLHMKRALKRIAHEIMEKNIDLDNTALIGIRTRGVYIAERIRNFIHNDEGFMLPCGILDITLHRDDLFIKEGKSLQIKKTEMDFGIDGKNIVLVDDVLFSGRTVRAAMDELIDFGRPKKIQLAVLIDRGHRELPIRADYVGKNIPTSIVQSVKVRVKEADDIDEVVIVEE